MRASGILLHPTSLPGRYGIGDLGPEAYRFADWLAAEGQTIWQVLPLGPVGYGESPYQLFSAFAGNPLLISLEGLDDEASRRSLRKTASSSSGSCRGRWLRCGGRLRAGGGRRAGNRRRGSIRSRNSWR